MHEHNDCQHENLKFCSHCRTVYCEKCGKEWYEDSYHYRYFGDNRDVFNSPNQDWGGITVTCNYHA